MEYRPEEKMMAASVIKLYIMADAFRRIDLGVLDPDQMITVKKEDYVPSCGAVAYMHEGLQVTVMDLITLMIIFSDNTATNILIDLLGMESIGNGMKELGCRDAWLRRKMYDLEKSQKGIQNLITARETGELLERMQEGKLVSRESSERMIGILKNQQLNGKIPFYLQALPEEPEIAHKTGEDSGITHDVGIVYAKQPFVVCFCGNETDTPAFERVMADIALQLYRENSGRIGKGAREE
jgi:beta-lactamase class A